QRQGESHSGTTQERPTRNVSLRDKHVVLASYTFDAPVAQAFRPAAAGLKPRATRVVAGFHPHLKRSALDDAEDDRRKAVVVPGGVSDDRSDNRHVVVLDAPA